LNKQGHFITFEGADGSGKSTQLKLTAEYLANKGYDVITTRDPGGTPLGSRIRDILLHHEGYVSSNCELFLYLADRAQHIDEKILPAIKQGKIVLCDRYVDSTLAYQGYARGINVEQILMLNNIVTKSLMPDLTFVFDVSTDVADKRIGDSKDRLESEAKEFHQKVKQGFLSVAERFKDRIIVVNADNDIDEIFSEVAKKIDNFLTLQ